MRRSPWYHLLLHELHSWFLQFQKIVSPFNLKTVLHKIWRNEIEKCIFLFKEHKVDRSERDKLLHFWRLQPCVALLGQNQNLHLYQVLQSKTWTTEQVPIQVSVTLPCWIWQDLETTFHWRYAYNHSKIESWSRCCYWSQHQKKRRHRINHP